MASNPNGRSLRRNIISILTKTAQSSTAFMGTFLLIHLSAPVMANFGGSSLASSTMLVGREYYQTHFGERYLLLLPMGIHIASAVAKRLLTTKDDPPMRKITGKFAGSAYLSALFFVPIHFLTHRFYPALSSPSIQSVGPSELDYEFVKTGLETWPLRSWFLYAGLAGFVAIHSVEGINLMLNTTFYGAWEWARKLSAKQRTRVVLASFLPVMSGIWMLKREGLMAFGGLVTRYQEALKCCFVYRL